MSMKFIKKLVTKAVDKVTTDGVRSVKTRATLTEMVMEFLSDQWQNLGPSAVDEVETEITLKTAEVWSFVEAELRVGRASVIRNARGKLHVRYNKELCVCGWTWASQRVEVTRRNLPTAGDTAGWCLRCHAWARDLACVG